MIDSQRHLFSIPDDVHYLNCAYMSPLLRSVEAAGFEGVRTKSRPWALEVGDFFDPAERLRELTGRLVNAPAERVALIPAVSYGAGIAANAAALGPGRTVVVPAEEFPSMVYPWRERCRQTGAELRTVGRPEGGERVGPRWSEHILEAIGPETAAVALTVCHWTDGALFDVAAIARRAREVGALVVLDGTQSVGALPFDFAAVQPDLLVCAGYKWMLGPYGLGVVVAGERLADAEPLEYNWINREASEDFARLVHYRDGYQPGARRFDVGERSNFVLVPMLNEALRQVLAWGPAAIQEYCGRLADALAARLEGTPYRLTDATGRASHLFGVQVPDPGTVPAIQAALKRRGVYVSQRGSSLRVSPHLYNTEADVDALAEVLLAAAE